MTSAPIIATIDPKISYASGFFLSTSLPQVIEDTMNMPPYAAYTTKFGWLQSRDYSINKEDNAA